MYLDDCASGGRRIDLEMMTRSVVQTRSDAAVAPGRAEWNQSQMYGLNLFLPVHATIGWETGTYECRSRGGGLLRGVGHPQDEFPVCPRQGLHRRDDGEPQILER